MAAISWTQREGRAGGVSVVRSYVLAPAVGGDYLWQLAEAGRGRLDWVKTGMMRQNIAASQG